MSTKKYCITQLSVRNLAQAEKIYGGFTFEHLGDFERNFESYQSIREDTVDLIYIYSKLLSDSSEFGGILSANVFIWHDGIFWVDAAGEVHRIPEGSIVYLLRIEGMPIRFVSFLIRYARSRWNIQVVTASDYEKARLTTKCHSLLFADPEAIPVAVIPYVSVPEDAEYLFRHIRSNSAFDDKIIVKKAGTSLGNWVMILNSDDQDVVSKYVDFAWGRADHIIMECLETTDLEYRVYWTKKNGVAEIFQVHGKERKQGHVLHNIAQGNTLRFFELSDIPQGLIEKIRDYCSAIPDSHGGLDVLESTDGRFFFTENNVMPGYFDSEWEKPIAPHWLDAIASVYK